MWDRNDIEIVFLSITKRENKYALNVEGISFAGECFIGTKESESNKFRILEGVRYGIWNISNVWQRLGYDFGPPGVKSGRI